MGESEYNSVPSVMDEASEQRIDIKYITWNLNVETSTANTNVFRPDNCYFMAVR